MTDDIFGSSQVHSLFVKEKVNDKLGELYEQLRVENTQIRKQLMQT